MSNEKLFGGCTNVHQTKPALNICKICKKTEVISDAVFCIECTNKRDQLNTVLKNLFEELSGGGEMSALFQAIPRFMMVMCGTGNSDIFERYNAQFKILFGNLSTLKQNSSFDEISKWVDLIERVKKINDEFLELATQVNQDTFKAVAPIDITAIINEFNLILKGSKDD